MNRPTFFPPEVVNPITIFPRYSHPTTLNNINVTCVLQGCIWNQNSISVANRTGALSGFNTTIRIPYLSKYTGRKYISPTLWNSMSYEEVKDDYWTFNPVAALRPLVCNGALDHQFAWSPPSGANTIVVQENALMQANPNVRRGLDVNDILFGIEPNLTEDDIMERYPEKYAEMNEFWAIIIRA